MKRLLFHHLPYFLLAVLASLAFFAYSEQITEVRQHKQALYDRAVKQVITLIERGELEDQSDSGVAGDSTQR